MGRTVVALAYCQNQQKSHPTCEPMGKLDDGFNLSWPENYFALTGGPMAATARPRAGGPHKRTPQNYNNIKCQYAPGKPGKFI